MNLLGFASGSRVTPTRTTFLDPRPLGESTIVRFGTRATPSNDQGRGNIRLAPLSITEVRIDSTIAEMDLYAVLGVEPSARRDQIRRAYLRLVAENHPDRHQAGSWRAEHRMAQINVAATVLLDPARRRRYDLRRGDARRTPPPPDRAEPPWWDRPATAVADDWEQPTGRPAEPCDPETARWIRACRPRAARAAEAFRVRAARCSVGARVALFVASVTISFALIAWSEPRSLRSQPTGTAASELEHCS